MAQLFANGQIADLVLVFMGVEVLGLLALGRLSGRGFRAVDVIVLMLPGLFLLLALRAALVGSDWWQIAICLAAALAAHLVDLRRRLGPAGSRDDTIHR